MKVLLKIYDHSVYSRTAFLGAVQVLGAGRISVWGGGRGAMPNNMASKGRGTVKTKNMVCTAGGGLVRKTTFQVSNIHFKPTTESS